MKTVTVTETISLSFWGFIKHQRYGLVSGIAVGLTLAQILYIVAMK